MAMAAALSSLAMTSTPLMKYLLGANSVSASDVGI
jgi:hypothetical protein